MAEPVFSANVTGVCALGDFGKTSLLLVTQRSIKCQHTFDGECLVGGSGGSDSHVDRFDRPGFAVGVHTRGGGSTCA